MDYDDMLEQVDALAVGLTKAERGFVDVLMSTQSTLTPEHQAEIQSLYEYYVSPMATISEREG